ncbi:MAG: hypothetical protein WKF78_06980 [Candidatus Limnocylindrales bacterium]
MRSTTITVSSGAVRLVWNGKDGAGKIVPDGTYEVRLTPRDAAGNNGTRVTRSVIVNTSLGQVETTKTLFYPQDADRLAPPPPCPST